jgi:hypothetical protein
MRESVPKKCTLSERALPKKPHQVRERLGQAK